MHLLPSAAERRGGVGVGGGGGGGGGGVVDDPTIFSKSGSLRVRQL